MLGALFWPHGICAQMRVCGLLVNCGVNGWPSTRLTSLLTQSWNKLVLANLGKAFTMTTLLQPDVCDPVVSLEWITRKAESQVAQLCAVDQAKIAKTLLRPLPRNRCGLVENLAKYRVYHFRASKTLRVSYRPTDQGLCIIHVGKHSEFDSFAEHFAGDLPINLVPLQESMVMKNNQHIVPNNTIKSTATQSNVPPAPLVAGDEEQMLVESLRELIGKAVAPRHEAMASDWGTRLDAIRKETEQIFQAYGRCGKTSSRDHRFT
jgi:hypothetical protein